MKKLYTSTLYIRVSPEQKELVELSAGEMDLEPTTFARNAIMDKVKKCACGLYWKHSGKHAR